MALVLILVAIVLMAGSGLPGLFLPRRSSHGQWVALVLTVLGAGAGLVGAGLGLAQLGGGGSLGVAPSR